MAGSIISHDGTHEYQLGGRHLPILLTLLALERRRVVSRHELAQALWDDDLPATWEASLRVAVGKVRTFLGECGYEPGTLASSTGGYHLRLRPDDEIVIDLKAAVEALGVAESALDSGQASAAIELARRAQVLLDAPLLPASAGAWVEARRHQARTQLVRALEVQAEAWLALAKPAASVAAAQRAVELDAFRESAHRLLMRGHANAGNKAEALACYERCRRLLSDELGVDPAPESEAVYLQVLRDEIPPASGPASAPPAVSSDAIEQDQSPQELERVGEAALWSGDHQHSISARQRAYRAYLEAGDRRSAARVALALASNHGIRSELAEAEGWYRTAARLLEAEPEAPEHGFLAAVGAIVLFEVGELPACHQQARRSLELGERFGIPDLQALGLTFLGLGLARQDRPAEAFPMLDEAMTLALAGRVTPFTAGVIFCRTIRTSLDLFDFRRAAEWIGAILRSATDAGFAGYPGDCFAHLAAALEARGSWGEAERQAEKACQACERFELSHVGLAWYTIGEIQLRRGEFARADEAFQRATDYGVSPQPGRALLQRARSDVAGALASVRTWLDGTSIRLMRARVLPAAVEIALAAGDQEFARRAAGELVSIADVYGTIALRAAAACARGWVALARGESRAALRDLRAAAALFREAEMPYQLAVARRRLAEALLAQGDRVGARAELAAAARLFDRLGAAPDARHAGQWLAQLERSTTPSV